jgi:catechol 2,3-dioxygenase
MADDDLPPIDPSLRFGAVHLAVADLGRSVDFYIRALGLKSLFSDEEHAVLGARVERPLLKLAALPAPTPPPARCTGLFHLALLHPDRPALADTFVRLDRAGWRLSGAADHGVSEALYLEDPDGLGLELYADRPTAEWPRPPGGRGARMHTAPLDLRSLLAEAHGGGEAEVDSATTIGHIHLKVSELERSLAFYRDAVGLEEQARLPGAVFLSAAGYHHHVGLNTWQSEGAPPPPASAPGLRLIELHLDGVGALSAVEARLRRAKIPALERHGDGVTVRDPDGQELSIAHRPAAHPGK